MAGFSKQRSCSYDTDNGGSKLSMLDDDLLVEILSKLPLKSLFRSAIVCKSWQSLINSDYLRRGLPFITSAVYYSFPTAADDDKTVSKNPQYGFISANDRHLETVALDFLPPKMSSSSPVIVDCCNGVILMYDNSTFIICDPIRKRWRRTPEPPKSSLLAVLTYEPSKGSYKVVSFTEWRRQGTVMQVFSPETGEWSEHDLDLGVDTSSFSTTMNYSDGKLYVLARPRQLVGINLDGMITCDVTDIPETASYNSIVGWSCGRLHFAAGDDKHLRIWVTDESHRNNWRLKCSVDLKRVCGGKMRAAAFHPEMEAVYGVSDGKLVSLDTRSGKTEEVCEFGSDKMCGGGASPIHVSLFPFSECNL